MGATFHATNFGIQLGYTLTYVSNTASSNGRLTGCLVGAGVRPANPSINGSTLGSRVPLPSNTWTAASNGVAVLNMPIGVSTTSSGTATFLRFSSGSSAGMESLDVDIGLSGSSEKAIVNTVTIPTGTTNTLQVLDMRLRIATEGAVCVSPSVANHIINLLTNNLAANPVPSLGAFSRYSTIQSAYTGTVTVEAWDGAIPTNSTANPTGNKLWTTNITGNELFGISGASAALVVPLTAAAIASGTPTFIRARKDASGLFPATSLQAPVSPLYGVQFSNNEMVLGQTNTLTNLTITFQA